MSDLIDRQAAIDAIEEYADRLQMVNWKENPGVPYKAYALNWCINTIRDLPSAQPEIIRCGECKYWDTTWQNDWAPNHHYCPNVDGVRRNDFYCGDAERRDDETN